MTLKEIQRQIDVANAAPIADGTSERWDMLPRIFYKDLPPKLKKEADKITTDTAQRFLFECYHVGTLESIAADQETFTRKIAEALHSARYLVESTDTTPPEKIGIEPLDAATREAWSPVSLIAADFIDAWEAVTGIETGKHPKLSEYLLTSKFVPMLNGTASNDIMLVSTRGLQPDRYSHSATIKTKDGREVTIENFDKLKGVLGTPAQKMLDTSLMYLTNTNYFRSNPQTITPTVEIPLIEYGETCGYRLTPQAMDTAEEQAKENKRVSERIKELKKMIRRDLTDLEMITWTGTETKGKNKYDYARMRIISSHSIRNGIIRINFDVDAAAYFVNSYVMQYPTALLKHDNRKPNAYVIGRKIAFHNSLDRNHEAGTESTLSVKSLLAAAPEIPTIEDIQARHQRNWKDKIKKPLEIALDENIAVGLLSKWEYRDPKTGDTFTSETAQPLTWTQYSRLMVDFTIIDAPDQSERRAVRAEEAAKAAEQKKRMRGRPKKS